MWSLTRGVARETVSARERLDQEELDRLRRTQTLIVDDRRRRPLYFDGRFLAARDLTRDQSYFLVRQADLGRSTGGGVVHGLMLSPGAEGGALVIDAGHGITPAGESVMLQDAVTLRIWDVPRIQRLDAAFGLSRRPVESARNPTGLFIVALRAVEFSANPIASYPTSLTEKRSVEDGDIIEAVAITLIPFADQGGDTELPRRRARAARTIFVEGVVPGPPVNALPLGLVALDRGTVRWVDNYLVRRDVGAAHADPLGLGYAPRATREAFLVQHRTHLADVLAERDNGSLGRRFAATEYFFALPPAGQLPAAALNARDLTQSYFPPEVPVDLSFVPEEELPALIEESLRLPPIDLTLAGDALESTSVLVLVPVPLARLRALRADLERITRPLPTAAPGLVAQRRPLEILRGLAVARLPHLVPAIPALASPEAAAWTRAVGESIDPEHGLLWYVRRRNLDYRSDVAGVAVRIVGSETEAETGLTTALTNATLLDRYRALTQDASTLARSEVVTLLGSPTFRESPTLLRAGLTELEAAKAALPAGSTLDRGTVLKVAGAFAQPGLGEGLKRLEEKEVTLRSDANVVEGLALLHRVPAIDRAGRTLADDKLADWAHRLAAAAAARDAQQLDALLSEASLGAQP